MCRGGGVGLRAGGQERGAGGWVLLMKFGGRFFKSHLQSLHLLERTITQHLTCGRDSTELLLTRELRREDVRKEDSGKEGGRHECSCLQVRWGPGGLAGKAGVREWGRGTLTSEVVPTVPLILDSLFLVSRN